MSDVVEFSDGGRTYRVTGLQAKSESINSAALEMDEIITARLDAAKQAMKEWKGKHVVTFAEDLNDVLSKMAGFRVKLWQSSRVLANFPDEPSASIGTAHYVDSIYMGARVDVPEGSSTASATPSDLRAYTETSSGQDSRYSGLAAKVNLDGVTAEVSYHRDLTPAERQRAIDGGMTEDEAARETRMETDAVSADLLKTLIPLPTPQPQIPPLKTKSTGVGEFTTAVAQAFEEADQPLLDLLAEYPDLAGYVVDGMGEGRVSGESSLAILLAYFKDFDTAGHGGDRDGEVSKDDLEAIMNDEDMPEYVQEAAEYLIDNPTLFQLAETMNDRPGDALGEHGDGRISEDDIRDFLEFNEHLRTLQQNYSEFDTAAEGGDTDGEVSQEDLEAMADGNGELAEAAQYLLDNDTALNRLNNYAAAKKFGGYNHGGIILEESLIGLAVDQQIYGDRPEEARTFVNSLPAAEEVGESGLPIWLSSDDGTIALANAALMDTVGDLSDSHQVIAHLPETEGGVRNRLITAFYDELAQRADAVFAGPELAGDPEARGHPGMNWLLMAPWASNTAGSVITGDFSAWGQHPNMGERQAMADGNQWIFDDIGSRMAAFIELYESNPSPSDSELSAFFNNNFDEGDGTIRTGLAAYVAAMQEPDPVRRQELMFEGNSLVAIHEQAGVQPHLENLDRWYVPDSLELRYSDTNIDGERYDLDRDVPETELVNNHVQRANFFDLDPGGNDPGHYLGTDIDLPDMGGVESWDDEFPTSLRQMHEEGGEHVWIHEHGAEEILPNPEGTEGSASNSSWQDRNERMYYIIKLFEQNHSNPRLYNTEDNDLSLDDLTWLSPDTGWR